MSAFACERSFFFSANAANVEFSVFEAGVVGLGRAGGLASSFSLCTTASPVFELSWLVSSSSTTSLTSFGVMSATPSCSMVRLTEEMSLLHVAADKLRSSEIVCLYAMLRFANPQSSLVF